VAEVAVALRIPPEALLRCDDEVLDHLVAIAERERTQALWAAEVSAVTAELVHALWRVTVQVNSKKGTRPPAPLHLPRPWRAEAPVRRVTVAELARRLGPGGG
jgi:hypothetical protein